MANKTDLRQIRTRTVLPMIGVAADTGYGDAITQNTDSELGKLFEDRNIILTDGGNISFSGTVLSFTENLNLTLNSKTVGGSPLIISLGSASRTLSASGRMIYAVVNRTGGTAVVTDDSATLPQTMSANQEVFLIAKRLDAGDATIRVYFRSGFVMNAGDTTRLGGSQVADTSEGLLTNNLSAGSKTILSSKTLFIPYLTIQVADVYTINAGAQLISVTSIINNGTLINNGITRIL